eukprot:GHVN01058741.1.p1 GENE.GHVN01058741.1~~GHVN01058741.1.p1  ORF type:complete len:778 (-),score=137.02 GHVN01058741.1:1726-3903(-)
MWDNYEPIKLMTSTAKKILNTKTKNGSIQLGGVSACKAAPQCTPTSGSDAPPYIGGKVKRVATSDIDSIALYSFPRLCEGQYIEAGKTASLSADRSVSYLNKDAFLLNFGNGQLEVAFKKNERNDTIVACKQANDIERRGWHQCGDAPQGNATRVGVLFEDCGFTIYLDGIRQVGYESEIYTTGIASVALSGGADGDSEFNSIHVLKTVECDAQSSLICLNEKNGYLRPSYEGVNNDDNPSMLWGRVTLDQEWRPVHLKAKVKDPVVFAQTVTFNKDQFLLVDINVVEGDIVQMRLRGPRHALNECENDPASDSAYLSEEVDFFVMSKGEHDTVFLRSEPVGGEYVEGTPVVVGVHKREKGKEGHDVIVFEKKYEKTPVVILMIQSKGSDRFMFPRLDGVCRMKFKYQLQNAASLDSEKGKEAMQYDAVVGYIVIPQRGPDDEPLRLAKGKIPFGTRTEKWATNHNSEVNDLSLQPERWNEGARPMLAFGQTQTTNGVDEIMLRIVKRDEKDATVTAEKSRCVCDNTSHSSEEIWGVVGFDVAHLVTGESEGGANGEVEDEEGTTTPGIFHPAMPGVDNPDNPSVTWGRLKGVTHMWREVRLEWPIPDPVVLASITTYNDDRITYVQFESLSSQSFRIRLRGPRHKAGECGDKAYDGTHYGEGVDFMILKKGVYSTISKEDRGLGGNYKQTIQVGKVTLEPGQRKHEVRYGMPFNFVSVANDHSW